MTKYSLRQIMQMVEMTNKTSLFVFGGLPKVELEIYFDSLSESLRFKRWSHLKAYMEDEYQEWFVADIMRAKFEYIEDAQHFEGLVDTDKLIYVYIVRKS